MGIYKPVQSSNDLWGSRSWSSNQRKEVSSFSRNGFEVFTKRFGKDISLGKRETQKGAEELLVGKLRGTLAASGFIEKGGEKLKVSELNIRSDDFTRGKRDEFRLVQKQNRRLSQRPETQEIKMFKSKAGGKNKFGIWTILRVF